MLVYLLIPTALAQAVSGGDSPSINVQNYRPPVDSERTLWTVDPGLMPDAYYSGRLWFHYANAPLIYTSSDDADAVLLVEHILQADAIGYVAFNRARFGVDIPIYLWSAGTAVQNGTGLGDLVADLKYTLVDPEEKPVGFALSGRLLMPTSSVVAPLGIDTLEGELEAAAGHTGEKLLVAANLGVHLGSVQELENVTLNDAFLFRAGLGYAITENGGVSVDFAGHTELAEFGNTAGAPIEGLLGGWVRASNLVVRAGVGTGLTTGIGSPMFRGVLGLAWEPPRVRDSDKDGIIDEEDRCPEVPEDADGYMDLDGCPDTAVNVVVRFESPDGELLSPTRIDATCGTQKFEGAGELQLQTDPMTCTLTASLADYEPVDSSFTVPAGSAHEVEQIMKAIPGVISLKVVDPAGQPVPNPSWTVERGDTFKPLPADGKVKVKPGKHVLRASAPGYRNAREQVEIKANQEITVQLQLMPTKVEVTKEKIDLREKVFFDTGKATIQPASFAMLDEVADVLKDHPEYLLVSIEGHTDSRGSDKANKKLSDARAASVRQYLVDKGVDAARLTSVGYGEERPIDKRNIAEAWEKNRRVDIVIQKRSD